MHSPIWRNPSSFVGSPFTPLSKSYILKLWSEAVCRFGIDWTVQCQWYSRGSAICSSGTQHSHGSALAIPPMAGVHAQREERKKPNQTFSHPPSNPHMAPLLFVLPLPAVESSYSQLLIQPIFLHILTPISFFFSPSPPSSLSSFAFISCTSAYPVWLSWQEMKRRSFLLFLVLEAGIAWSLGEWTGKISLSVVLDIADILQKQPQHLTSEKKDWA